MTDRETADALGQMNEAFDRTNEALARVGHTAALATAAATGLWQALARYPLPLTVTDPVPSLRPQITWSVAHRVYGACPRCGMVVQLNKPLIGGLHVCFA